MRDRDDGGLGSDQNERTAAEGAPSRLPGYNRVLGFRFVRASFVSARAATISLLFHREIQKVQ